MLSEEARQMLVLLAVLVGAVTFSLLWWLYREGRKDD